jgi:hypothetical protein
MRREQRLDLGRQGRLLHGDRRQPNRSRVFVERGQGLEQLLDSRSTVRVQRYASASELAPASRCRPFINLSARPPHRDRLRPAPTAVPPPLAERGAGGAGDHGPHGSGVAYQRAAGFDRRPTGRSRRPLPDCTRTAPVRPRRPPFHWRTFLLDTGSQLAYLEGPFRGRRRWVSPPRGIAPTPTQRS